MKEDLNPKHVEVLPPDLQQRVQQLQSQALNAQQVRSPSQGFDPQQTQQKQKHQHHQGKSMKGSPFSGGKKKAGKPIILMLADAISATFSHKGIFWLGFTVFIAAFYANWMFWSALMLSMGVEGGWEYIWGFGASFGITLFELTPVIWESSRKSNAHQQFALASTPNTIPDASHMDASKLQSDYKNMDRKTRKFFETMRWAAIGLEVFLGITYLGRIGVGMRALFQFLVFLASIFGAEWGAKLALRAADWELPPEVRQQFNEWWNNRSSVKMTNL